MKESIYNYYFSLNDEKAVIFNGRTKRFFYVSERNFKEFKEIITNPDTYFDYYKPFIFRMINEGFVIDDRQSEISLVKTEYDDIINPNSWMLLILPTYQCNMRCWYCLQKHQEIKMDKDIIARIEKHIDKYIRQNNIKHLYISWFGGEPLLEYDTIKEISSFAKSLCKKRNIGYTSGITTNGTLFDSNIIMEFRELGIYNYQITIDGVREQHNKVKRLPDGSAFDQTIENIKKIAGIMPEASIVLRINYTDKSSPEEIMKEINSLIPIQLRNFITITPRKVWQVDASMIPQKTIRKFRDIGKNDMYHYNGCTQGICYVSYKHFETIYPNGSVGKCDNDDMFDAKGELTSDGNVKWNDAYPFTRISLFNDNIVCNNCKHLPICWGPCPRKMDEMLINEGKITCIHTDPEQTMKEYILDYICSCK